MRTIRLVAGVVFLGVLAATVLPAPTLAAPNIAPDPQDFQAGEAVFMEVAQPGNGALDAPDALVTLFFKDSNDNYVNIHHIDHCSYSSKDRAPAKHKDTLSAPGDWLFDKPGKGNTRFVATTANGSQQVGVVRNTIWLDNNSCENTSYRLDLNELQKSTQPGLEDYYEARVWTSIVEPYPGAADGMTNAFKLQVPRGDNCDFERKPRSCNYVSYSPDAGIKFALQQRGTNNQQEFTSFDVKFGTRCDLESAQTKRIRWFNDAQGNQNIQGRQVSFSVLEKKSGSSNYTLVNLQSDRNGDIWGHKYYPKSNGQDKERSTSITVKPDHDYIWRWYDVQTKNGLQVQVPYESVYHRFGCDTSPQS